MDNPGPGRPIVTGHRGAAALEPENTLRSFMRALELGVDHVETDVHLTADGEPVCIHDPTVDRTTNGTGAITGMTLKQIRRLDAGLGEQVPTLAEALELIGGKAVFQIELKAPGTAAPTVRLLQHARLAAEDVLVISFKMDLLEEVRALDPKLNLALILSQPGADMFDQAHRIRAIGLAINFLNVTPAVVQAVRAAGLKMHTWTADQPEQMQQLIDLGVDGITTNRPDLLLEMLGPKSGKYLPVTG